MSKRLTAIVASAVCALGFAGIAQAHVTVHPNALPSGGYTVIDVRVPNERPTTTTTRVVVAFPAGFYSVSFQAVPGWQAKIVYRKLAKPATFQGQAVKQEVGQLIFTGKLPPHQFVEFPVSVAVPKLAAGTVLTFKALQTYSNGEIVRWIGPPSADTPAPQVVVTTAGSPVQDYPGGVSAIKKARTTQSAFVPAAGALVALPLLGVAGLGLTRRRRRHSESS